VIESVSNIKLGGGGGRGKEGGKKEEIKEDEKYISGSKSGSLNLVEMKIPRKGSHRTELLGVLLGTRETSAGQGGASPPTKGKEQGGDCSALVDFEVGTTSDGWYMTYQTY